MADNNQINNSILVVDDQPENIKILTDFLKEKGFNIYSTQYGKDVLNIVQNSLTDLILLDIKLPDIDGFEVCKIIKSNNHTKEIPVIFISATTKYTEKVKAFEVGGVDFISKPYNTDEVLSRINTHLELSKLRKLLKKQITETESKYQFIVENTDDVLWTMNGNLQLDYVSPSVYKLLGYTVEEHLKHTLDDFLTPESAYLIKKEFEIGMMHVQKKEYDLLKNIVEFDIELVKKDKTKKYALSKIYIIRDSQYNIIKIRGVTIDITERKIAEKSLRKSEQKFDNIIKYLPGYVSRAIDFPQLEIHYLSNGFEKITGYSIPEVLKDNGKIFFSCINPNDLNKCTTIAEKAIKLKESFEVEYRITTKDGKLKWLLKKGRGVYDNIGNYTYTEGYSTDITDRKNAEEDLRSSEEKYRLVANNSADVIFTLDLEMKYTFISPSIKNLRGFLPEELINQSVSRSLTQKSLNNIMSAAKEEFELEKNGKSDIHRSRTFELEMFRKDGSILWTETKASILRDNNKIMIGFLGITRDITERIKTQEIIAKNSETYRLISEKITDVVWLMDLTGSSTYVSPSIEKFTGFTVEEYLKQTIATRFTIESAEYGSNTFNNELKLYKNNPEKLINYTKQIELEYLCKDGSTKWGELIITPYFEKNNILTRIHGVTRDITERKKTEKVIAEKTNELERFNNLMVGRELKMIELKKEINEFLKKLGLTEKYNFNE